MKHYALRYRRLLYALRLGVLLVKASLFSAVRGDATTHESPHESPDKSPVPSPQMSDEDVTLATVTEISRRATNMMGDENPAQPLPHPLVTSANLDHHLGRATRARHAAESTNTKYGVDLLLPATDAQTDLDDALIHCLHQFDHRTKQQDQRIVELEAKLADAARRLSSLESEHL